MQRAVSLWFKHIVCKSREDFGLEGGYPRSWILELKWLMVKSSLTPTMSFELGYKSHFLSLLVSKQFFSGGIEFDANDDAITASNRPRWQVMIAIIHVNDSSVERASSVGHTAVIYTAIM